MEKTYTTLHINLPNEYVPLFRRMRQKTASRSNTATILAALRALEEKEAERDRALQHTATPIRE